MARMSSASKHECVHHEQLCSQNVALWHRHLSYAVAATSCGRMLTLAAMAAIADATLRLTAADAPSALSLHFSGKAQGTPHGFALHMHHFERESERGQLLQPHLAAIRTQLLDYFRATTARVPDDHLLFKFEHSLALGSADRLLMWQLSLHLGFPRDDPSLAR